jgi:hypothetical protein
MKAFPAHDDIQKRTVITKLIPILKTTYVMTCPECGQRFHASRCDAIYCSSRCRVRAWRRRQRDRKHTLEMQEIEPLFDRPLTDEEITQALNHELQMTVFGGH